MSNNKLDGAPRKQLSEQPDRLDTIIDALDVALAEAMRDAVAGAVREAVVAVTRELITNPDVLAAIAAAAAQAAPVARPTAPEPNQPAQGAAPSVRGRVRRAWEAALAFAAAWGCSALPAVKDRVIGVCEWLWRRRVAAGASLAV